MEGGDHEALPSNRDGADHEDTGSDFANGKRRWGKEEEVTSFLFLNISVFVTQGISSSGLHWGLLETGEPEG